jgi:hypothetical protein
MLLGHVQLDRRLFKAAVTQQHMNSPQNSAGFQQVGGKTMPQYVRVYFLFEAGAFCRLLARVLGYSGFDRFFGVVPFPSWKQPLPWFVLFAILTQHFKQPGAEHHKR